MVHCGSVLWLGWAMRSSAAAKTGEGRVLRLGHTCEVAAWKINTFGKLSIGKLNTFGKLPLGN